MTMVWARVPEFSNGVDGISAKISELKGPIIPAAAVVQEQDRSCLFGVSLNCHNSAAMSERYGETRHRLVRGSKRLEPLLCLIIVLITLPYSVVASMATLGQLGMSTPRSLASRASNGSSSLLQVFQVSPPVLSPADAGCKQTLMVHSFAYSYGMPFVGEYTPPSCKFNRVTFNFTVTSAGRQFDRLALMYFNDTEIFRTSTAEPTQTGIVWTYIKDMSNFLVLFKEPQKIIFDLGNLIDKTYTAAFNTTLTATFFVVEDTTAPADVILPVSAQQSASNSPSAFIVPDQPAVNTLTLPQNVNKAVFSISACGQAAEEFWWSNVLSSDTQTFGNATTLYGYSPFRELQLIIDGMLAGVAWPFPVIFTGGVVPGFWRPIVGIDAFDLREDEIDISPFLPLLCDGAEHTFEIRVAGINDDGKGHGNLTETVGSNWVVTGKIFLWLDPAGAVTKGTTPTQYTPDPVIQLSSSLGKAVNGSNGTLTYSVKVQRQLSFSSTIQTASGSHLTTWQQNLTYSNDGRFSDSGNVQVTDQNTHGVAASSNAYSRAYGYPLWVYSAYTMLAGGNYTIDGKMDRSKNEQTIGQLAFLSELQTFNFNGSANQSPASFTGTTSNNRQNGTATYLAVPSQSKSYGTGTTEQDLSLYGIEASAATIQNGDTAVKGSTELYHRHVLASNGTVVEDEQTLGGEHSQNFYPTQIIDAQSFARPGIRAMLGRGPF